jgi:hypothetical protein
MDREMKMGLNKVSFDRYEFAIKRYGYMGELTDEAFKEINSDIGISYKEVTDRNAIEHIYFQSKFTFDHGKYNTLSLLHLGYILCAHKDTERAGESLWGIVNPELKDTIERDEVRQLLHALTVMAIDLPEYFNSLQETKDKDVEEYLKELKEKREAAIEQAVKTLSTEVSKNQFVHGLVRFLEYVNNCNRELTGLPATRSDLISTPPRPCPITERLLKHS